MKPKWKLAERIGGKYENRYQMNLAVLLGVSYLRGKRNHYLELGLGITPCYRYYNPVEVSQNSAKVIETYLFNSGRIGYRFQKYMADYSSREVLPH